VAPARLSLAKSLFNFDLDESAQDAASAIETLNEAKIKTQLRARVEQVSQDNTLKDAVATTLRARVGYKSQRVNGFSGYLEAEATLGAGDYNSTKNQQTSYSKIPDPDLVEINQGYLEYQSGVDRFKLGRQRIIFDNARFIGNVGFRQNEQTYGAALVQNRSLIESGTLTYAYLSQIDNIGGKVIGSDSHLLNLGYQGFSAVNASVYSYWIGLKQTPGVQATDEAFNTSGLRLQSKDNSWIYGLEAATQTHQTNASPNVSQQAQYALIETGFQSPELGTFKLTSETLGGDGSYSFNTPLATKHAFNGWSDQFLSTPKTGLSDRFVSYLKTQGPFAVQFHQHQFVSDQGSATFGAETNLMCSYQPSPTYKLTFKAARFAPSQTSSYTQTTKLWVQVDANF